MSCIMSPVRFPITTRESFGPWLICSIIKLYYLSWEASAALKKRLAKDGIHLEGGAGGWAELYRVFRECKVRRFIFFTFTT